MKTMRKIREIHIRIQTDRQTDMSCVCSQVSSGGLAVYLKGGQEVWLETSNYRALTSIPAGVSVFSGFLMHHHQ